MAYDRIIYVGENEVGGDSPREQNKYLFWRISLVDNVHCIVSDMTDEQPYTYMYLESNNSRVIRML